MPITEAQLEARKHRLGASDVGKIMTGGGYDVWLQKTGKILVDPVQSEAASIGNDIEESVLTWAAAKLNVKIEMNIEVGHSELPLVAILDSLIPAEARPMDGKTSGLATPVNTRYRTGASGYMIGYGDPKTSRNWQFEVPDSVAAQMTAQMAACLDVYGVEIEASYVATLIGGRGRNVYHVKWDAELWEMMFERLHRFWFHNVVRDIPPDDSRPTWEYAKHVPVKTGTSVFVPESLIQDLKTVQSSRRELEKMEDSLKSLVRAQGAEYLLPESGDGELVHVTHTVTQAHWEPAKPARYVEDSERNTVRIVKKLPKNVKLIGLDEAKQLTEGDGDGSSQD